MMKTVYFPGDEVTNLVPHYDSQSGQLVGRHAHGTIKRVFGDFADIEWDLVTNHPNTIITQCHTGTVIHTPVYAER